MVTQVIFMWPHSVVVSTRDFESRDLGSNPSGAFKNINNYSITY